jgi:hypothetical protein
VNKRMRELARLPGVKQVTVTSGRHYRLTLANGSSVFTGSTPGDVRSIRNAAARIRRMLRQERRQWA